MWQNRLAPQTAILAASAAHPSTRCGTWVLAAAILGSSMTFIDGTVVNVGLPLQSALGATISSSVGGRLLCTVSGNSSFGRRLTRGLYRRPKIFAVGVILFAAASSCCGLAADVGHLIAAFGLKGIGGALLVPGSLALISASFSSEEGGLAIRNWSGFTV